MSLKTSYRHNMVVFCFCSKTHNTSECWSGSQKKCTTEEAMSFCFVSDSKCYSICSCLSVMLLSQNCYRANPCPLFCLCLCLKKPRISKSNVQLRYGVFLIFEYPWIGPDLFCPRYSTLKGGLLKMSRRAGPCSAPLWLFLSGFINGSGCMSQKGTGKIYMICLCFSLALSLESLILWKSGHISQKMSADYHGVVVFCFCLKELFAQIWWARVLRSLIISAEANHVFCSVSASASKSREYQKSRSTISCPLFFLCSKSREYLKP